MLSAEQYFKDLKALNFTISVLNASYAFVFPPLHSQPHLALRLSVCIMLVYVYCSAGKVIK